MEKEEKLGIQGILTIINHRNKCNIEDFMEINWVAFRHTKKRSNTLEGKLSFWGTPTPRMWKLSLSTNNVPQNKCSLSVLLLFFIIAVRKYLIAVTICVRN